MSIPHNILRLTEMTHVSWCCSNFTHSKSPMSHFQQTWQQQFQSAVDKQPRGWKSTRSVCHNSSTARLPLDCQKVLVIRLCHFLSPHSSDSVVATATVLSETWGSVLGVSARQLSRCVSRHCLAQTDELICIHGRALLPEGFGGIDWIHFWLSVKASSGLN